MASFPERRPLPVNYYPQDSNSAIHDAYDHCLRREHGAGNDSQLLMYARCLGYLITEAPDDDAREYIASEILTCMGDGEKMNELARFYMNHLFRLCELASWISSCFLIFLLSPKGERSYAFPVLPPHPIRFIRRGNILLPINCQSTP